MVDFHSYLTDQRIVAQLCKEVSKYIFCPPNRPVPEHIRHLLRLLPPRHLWANLSYDQRHDKDVRKVTIRRLRHIITRHLDHHSSYAYMPRLQAFMESLRFIAKDPNSYIFPKPVVKAKIKKQKGNIIMPTEPSTILQDLTDIDITNIKENISNADRILELMWKELKEFAADEGLKLVLSLALLIIGFKLINHLVRRMKTSKLFHKIENLTNHLWI